MKGIVMLRPLESGRQLSKDKTKSRLSWSVKDQFKDQILSVDSDSILSSKDLKTQAI